MKNIIKKIFGYWGALNPLIILIAVICVWALLVAIGTMKHSVETQKIQACKEISKNVAEFEDCLD